MPMETCRLMSPLAARLNAARAQTDALFELLHPEALYQRPVIDRHRLIFYLGHLEAFDWNLVCRGTLGQPAFHESFDRLFAFGIDPEPGGAPADQASDWPSEKEVRAYGARTRRAFDDALARVPEELLHVAIEHRLMHAETLAYLFHSLPYEWKRGPAPAESTLTGAAAPENPMVEIPEGAARLGRPRGDGFGWDNEFAEHSVQVPPFRIARFKVSNGEYLDYVRAGARAPHFWRNQENRWFLRGMFAEIPLPLDWPVYVTHSEASAYARWRGGSLPSEAQFHRAAEGAAPVNVNFERWDPVPIHFPQRPRHNGRPQQQSLRAGEEAAASWGATNGVSRHGVAQLLGNGWEWTSTVFGPFPGFEPFPFYRGYSADFFDGSHYVVKGGSPRTAACMLRPSFRNWFRPDYRYVYAGFRIKVNI
jgi:iron(II)-dependent oxidoreductase